ncbi:copper amine oxidase N-terminal domain-containing protein [Paenibacillus sp. P25]|nr:copper amine oxidase N-terminal domain-containing protein [Paenibacillus sp. P25]
MVEGTTLVQFRPLFEAMGMKVQWDEATRIVTGSKEGLQITLRIDDPHATVNGKQMDLAQSAQIVSGKHDGAAAFYRGSHRGDRPLGPGQPGNHGCY